MPNIRIIPSIPALMLEGERRHLVITDIHIGFEGRFASRKIFVGKNTSIEQTISDVQQLIRQTSADSLIVLGDVKSGTDTISYAERRQVPQFFSSMKNIDVTITPGNHDGNIATLLPENISVSGSSGTVIEGTLFTHGHSMPSEKFGDITRIIMGHIHPVFINEDSVLNGQKVWVSIKADRDLIFPSRSGEIEITIVPSFNSYLHATTKSNSENMSPIIRRITKGVNSARIVTLDGTIIGDETSLDHVI